MEKQNNYSIHIKTNNPILNNHDFPEIVLMICKMAKETENKSLNEKKVTDAVLNFISNKIFGQYFLIVDNSKKSFCGMNMITYEYNINSNKTIVWLQSVFIEKEYRMKKLFKSLLEENENFVRTSTNFEQKVKLYMEKNNSTAEQVYFKLGFHVTDEVLFEIDYDFDDIKFLNSEKINEDMDMNLKSEQTGIYMQVLTDENSQILNENLNSEFFSNISNRKINLKEQINSINNVLKDGKKGKIIVVKDNLNKVICLFYIFYEYSDWRNSIFWWIYDFIINNEYTEYVNYKIDKIIYTLIKLNYQSGSCGIRFLTTSNKTSFLEDSVLNKSHYIIYEKNI